MSHIPPSRYDKFPTVAVPGNPLAWSGQDAWQEIARGGQAIVVDTYPGVKLDELLEFIGQTLPGHQVLNVEELAARPIADHHQDPRARGRDQCACDGRRSSDRAG